MNNRIIITLVGVVGLAGAAVALDLDPGTSTSTYGSGNGGTDEARGVWFKADENLTIYGGGFKIGFASGNDFTMRIKESDAAGDLFGTTLDSFYIADTGATNDYVDGLFGGPVNLIAGQYYNIEVITQASFANQEYYNWDNSPVDLGALTILDGHRGAGTGLSNTLAPILRVNTVPEPTTMALLGLGGLALLRRKKKSA